MSDLEQSITPWLLAVSRRTGVELQLDVHGACGMDCGNGLNVGVAALEPDRVGLFAAVAWANESNRVALYGALLSRNLFGVQPHGAALGLDAETDTAYLCQPLVAAELDAPAFEDKLGAFILAARAALDELASSSLAQDAAAPAEPMPWSMLRA